MANKDLKDNNLNSVAGCGKVEELDKNHEYYNEGARFKATSASGQFKNYTAYFPNLRAADAWLNDVEKGLIEPLEDGHFFNPNFLDKHKKEK